MKRLDATAATECKIGLETTQILGNETPKALSPHPPSRQATLSARITDILAGTADLMTPSDILELLRELAWEVEQGEDFKHRLITFFCPWMDSEKKPGSYEYAVDVQDMLMADGFLTQVTKTDDGWWYVEPINNEG